ncbi:MAG: sulfatase [Candidatus Hydrogenedentes bacterium]|nr:sulfatase [Candidatus Hydrogenedentota bacterium]
MRIRRAAYSGVLLLPALWLCACTPEDDSLGPVEASVGGLESMGPNVVWILLDACRASNLSCYGYERQTSPAIDRLAARGALFEQAYAQGFETVRSVPSYMTGRHFAVPCLSIQVWQDLFKAPPPEEQLLPHILSENGYETVMVSAHPYITPESRLSRAFDRAIHLRGMPYAELNELVDAAEAYLEEPKSRPFFLYVHAMDTHFPHLLRPPYDQWVDPDYESKAISGGHALRGPIVKYSSEDQETLRGLHDGSILMSDGAIGRLVDIVERLGYAENTIWVIGADHGDLLGEDGRRVGHDFKYEEVMRVPLILAGPGIPAGTRSRALVENTDIVPTLVELLGLRTEAKFHGKPLQPLWGPSEGARLHEAVMAHHDDGTLVVRTLDHTYHYSLETQKETLWPGPRTAKSSPKALPADSAAAEAIRERVGSEFLPQWRSFTALPLREIDMPFIERIRLEHISNAGQILTQLGEAPDDTYPLKAKWTLYPYGLVNNGWLEGAPPVGLSIPVPNGKFHVQLELFTTELWGHPAGAVLVRAESDAAFKRIEDYSGRGHKFVELGEYEVSDGLFDVLLDRAVPEHWALVRRFRFIPAGIAAQVGTLEENQQREESLRALGYL